GRAMLSCQEGWDHAATANQPAITQHNAPVPTSSQPGHVSGCRPVRINKPRLRLASTDSGKNTAKKKRWRLVSGRRGAPMGIPPFVTAASLARRRRLANMTNVPVALGGKRPARGSNSAGEADGRFRSPFAGWSIGFSGEGRGDRESEVRPLQPEPLGLPKHVSELI